MPLERPEEKPLGLGGLGECVWWGFTPGSNTSVMTRSTADDVHIPSAPAAVTATGPHLETGPSGSAAPAFPPHSPDTHTHMHTGFSGKYVLGFHTKVAFHNKV